jgi:hypothetical protein
MLHRSPAFPSSLCSRLDPSLTSRMCDRSRHQSTVGCKGHVCGVDRHCCAHSLIPACVDMYSMTPSTAVMLCSAGSDVPDKLSCCRALRVSEGGALITAETVCLFQFLTADRRHAYCSAMMAKAAATGTRGCDRL